MKVIFSHYSLNSCRGVGQIFKSMFPDSNIAERMSIYSNKTTYLVNYALAPYFHSQLVSSIAAAKDFVVCFDESLNSIAQREQMDLVIRFWNIAENKVECRYLTSIFLGHTTSADILDKFIDGLREVGLKHLVQVSMDGPNVNMKFHRILKEYLAENSESPSLLDMGSCGLHVVHGRYKTGLTASQWKIDEFLRCSYYLLKDSPTLATAVI
jgi:hypothetical protein